MLKDGGEPARGLGLNQLVSAPEAQVFRIALGPEGLEDRMQDDAAVPGGQPPLRVFEFPCAQPANGEALKRACRLPFEHLRASGVDLPRPRDRGGIFRCLRLSPMFAPSGSVQEFAERLRVHRLGRFVRDRPQQGRSAQVLRVIPLRVAEDAFVGARGDAAGHRQCKLPVPLRVGVRHSGGALQLAWEQRMRLACRRPVVVVRPKKPDCVEGLPRGLEGAHDLDGRAAGLGREDRARRVAIKHGYEFRVPHAAAVEAEARDFGGEPLPAIEGLELNAGEGPAAGPGRLPQDRVREVEPTGKGIRPAPDALSDARTL